MDACSSSPSLRSYNSACSQLACITCCSDLQCEGHREARENATWKEQVLKGTTDVQKRAKAKRESSIRPGTFREPGFLYLNQTITIWHRQKFMENRKWREDAVRRAEKRKARAMNTTKPIRNSVKRFRSVVEDLYRKSLREGGNEKKSVLEEMDVEAKTRSTELVSEERETSIANAPVEGSTLNEKDPRCKMM